MDGIEVVFFEVYVQGDAAIIAYQKKSLRGSRDGGGSHSDICKRFHEVGPSDFCFVVSDHFGDGRFETFDSLHFAHACFIDEWFLFIHFMVKCCPLKHSSS